MPIRVICECGSRLDAPDELAGRKAKCGKCDRVLLIREGPEPNPPSEFGPGAEFDPSSEFDEAAGLEESSALRLPRRSKSRRQKVFQESDEAIRVEGQRKGAEKGKKKGSKASAPDAGLLAMWSRGLVFPLRREAIVTLLVLAALYGTVSQGLLLGPAVFAAGIMSIKSIIGYGTVAFLVFGYLCYFLFQTLRSAAQNEEDLPVAAVFDFEEIFIDLWLMVGGTGVVFAPLVALSIGGWLTGLSIPGALWWTIAFALLFLWPVAITSAALHTSVLGANHWTAAAAIGQMPFQYVATLLVVSGLTFVVLAIDDVLPSVFFISGFITSLLFFYTVVACVYLMGNLYYRNRARIGWFREFGPRY